MCLCASLPSCLVASVPRCLLLRRIHHQKHILPLALHEVPLAGELLQGGGVGEQLLREDRILADLIEIELLLELQLLQLPFDLLLPDEVVAVEKDQPHDEGDRGDEVLVQEDVEDLSDHFRPPGVLRLTKITFSRDFFHSLLNMPCR